MSRFFVIDANYIPFLKRLGVNTERCLKLAGIPTKQIQRNGLVVSKQQYIDLMNVLGLEMSEDQILQAADINKIMMFIPPLFAAMCAKDGIRCFERIATYKKLIGPFVLDVTKTREHLYLEFIFENNEMPMPSFTVLNEQALMVNIVRKATGKELVPYEVGSMVDYGEAYKEFFGVVPIKSQRNIVAFHLKDMEEPFLTVNNSMWSYLEPELIKRKEEVEIDESFAASVRSILFEFIPAGDDNIESVAKEMALSVRTLQRKLSAEDTSFIKQLNHTRELLARNYLKEKKITNDEIAFLIGYSDANAFQRAFRKWTGMTTGDYRKKF